MLGRNRYQAKAFIFDWKYLIIARKCIAYGIIESMWFSLPVSVSKLLAFLLSFDMISWIVFFQAINMGSSNLTHNVRVFYTHPKTTLIYFNAPSDFAFNLSILLSLGASSFWANWCEMAWIASGIFEFLLALLFPISGTTVMQSCRYIYIYILEYQTVCLMIRVYSGQIGWSRI